MHANTSAVLASGNYALIGFVGSEGATITQTVGAYSSADAGTRLVTATLGTGDFTADSGTLLSNYVLPTTATGLGQIDQATPTASIVNNPTKTYNGALAATHGRGQLQPRGLRRRPGGQRHRHRRPLQQRQRRLAHCHRQPRRGRLRGQQRHAALNYVLPTTASGAGTITQASLIASIIGTPTKTYDATTGAVLTTPNYGLSGFVGADGATVTETVGTHASANAGPRNVSAVLDAGDFTATGATVLANYVLPTTASGVGQIDPAQLIASIVGNPTRTYDGTTTAHLTSANYSLSELHRRPGASVTQAAEPTIPGTPGPAPSPPPWLAATSPPTAGR